jgi:hypothetical protein
VEEKKGERAAGDDAPKVQTRGSGTNHKHPNCQSLKEQALAYAARGWPVFPCKSMGKKPAITRGFYNATTNPATIERLWRIADRNIGMPTGPASGLWLFDLDGLEGESSLRFLEDQYGPLPATLESITGRGRHLYFQYTTEIPCSAGRIAPGIDVRGDGGYAILPPSVHETGRTYAWCVDSADDPAAAPDWLIERALKRPAQSISEQALATIRRPVSGSSGYYGAAALANEIAILAATAPGGRNHQLNRSAFALFQLVAGGELDHRGVAEALIGACHQNGLIKDDGLPGVRATIASGARAGLQHPRKRRAA